MSQYGWRLIESDSKQPAQRDKEYLDFRGEKHILLGGMPPTHAGSTGRVYTDKGSFFPSVIGMEWVNLLDDYFRE